MREHWTYSWCFHCSLSGPVLLSSQLIKRKGQTFLNCIITKQKGWTTQNSNWYLNICKWLFRINKPLVTIYKAFLKGGLMRPCSPTTHTQTQQVKAIIRLSDSIVHSRLPQSSTWWHELPHWHRHVALTPCPSPSEGQSGVHLLTGHHVHEE